jgi:hypothetical protein
MSTHADRRVIACALIFAGIVVAPTSTRAQARFELLSRDTLARTPDVTVVTIRDRRTSNCYALLIGGQGPAFGPPTAPVAGPTVLGPIVEVIQPPPPPATAYGSAGSITPWPVGYPGLWGSPGSIQNWGSTVNTGPGPWTAAKPGLQTNGWEPMAESIRRALVDPATVQALSAPLQAGLSDLDGRLRGLESMLQSADAYRTVAVWPVSCTANKP